MHEIRTIGLVVLPECAPIFDERATRVEIVDEAAGEFVAVTTHSGEVNIDPSEWETLREAIDRMIKECRL